ncbi:MAG: CHAT domain-containing protein [Planctomycetaceae bacterium]|jgi:CHAT domain-containing protein/tetratricopeptide (TPR) repeat protein|nr:CHAT domain-containing protein [Planctomycetaceae bacterium]
MTKTMYRSIFTFLFLLLPALLSAQNFDADAEKARLLIEAGKLNEAKPITDRLLKQAATDTDATALNDLGVAFEDLGCYEMAEPFHKRALEIREKRKDQYGIVQSLCNLGILNKNLGRYKDAEMYYGQALKANPDEFMTAVVRNNMGLLYQEQYHYEEAKPLYEQALKTYEKLYGKDDPYVAPPLHNLARLYRDQGNYTEAEKHQKRALSIDEKELGKDHHETAISLNGLAMIYREQKRYADAESLYQRCLEICRERLGNDHPQTADNLNDLAELYEKQGQDKNAEELYNQAIAVFDKTGMEARIGQIWYRNRAALYKKTDRPREAVTDLKRAMDLSLEVRKHASGGDEQRAQTFSRYYTLFEMMVDWQSELGDLNEAYEAMERSRAQGLQDLMNANNIDLLANVPAETARKLRNDESAALADVASCRKQLEDHINRNRMTADQKKEEERLSNALKAAQNKLVNATAAIRFASPAYRLMLSEGERKPIAFDTMRQELATEKTLALEYLIGGKKSYVLVYGGDIEPELLPLELNADQARLFHVAAGPLTSEKLRSILSNKEHSDGVLQIVANPKNTLVPFDQLAVLWDLLVPKASIRRLIKGRNFERLLVLPDGILARLPFEMLIIEPGAFPIYLLDAPPTVIYAPSATMYYNLKHHKTESDKPQTLTVGNAIYEADQGTKQIDPPANMHNSRRAARFGILHNLPASAKESSLIEDSCKKFNIPVERLDWDQSTEANVRKLVAGRTIVHLACHGLAEDDYGDALFSSLALTVGNANDTKDDGFIELGEMFELDLESCKLAVLSACDTNVGPDQRGEGTWSMGRGMLASGAKRAVTSNWQVDDNSTAPLVSNFINTINQTSNPDYATALRQAKQYIRQNSSIEGWRQEWRDNPYYWAPFVLIGTN